MIIRTVCIVKMIKITFDNGEKKMFKYGDLVEVNEYEYGRYCYCLQILPNKKEENKSKDKVVKDEEKKLELTNKDVDETKTKGKKTKIK